MKTIFKYSMALLALAVAVASCSDSSDDNDYSPATVSGPQVYFSNTLASQYEISAKETSFPISIARYDSVGNISVPLTVTMSEGSILNVPATVDFADGKASAEITVTYDPTKIEYGKYDTIHIAIADASMATNYGLSTYTFTAGATEWVTMDGTATYRDDLISSWYSVGNPTYSVTIEKSIVDEGKYRLIDPYGAAFGEAIGEATWMDDYYDAANTYYLEVDATDPNAVYVMLNESGVNLGSGMFSYTSYVEYLISKGNTLDDVKSARPELFGTMKDGIITMPQQAMLISEAEYNNGGWGYGNVNGLFLIAMPGVVLADYSAEVTFTGTMTDAAGTTYALASLSLGSDATNVKAVVIAANEDADAVAASIAAGETEATDVEAGTIQVAIPADLTGNMQILVVVLDDENAVQETAISKFEYYGMVNPWKSLGIGYYTEDALYPSNTEAGEPITIEVEIEEKNSTPGLYRMKNAYAPFAQWWGEGDGEASIIVHAENANGVYILEQPIGLTYNDEPITLCTEGGMALAYYESQGYTAEVVIASVSQYFGTLADNTITFPTFSQEEGSEAIYQGYLYYAADDQTIYAGTNGEMKIVLPTASEESRAYAKRAAAASSFAKRLNTFSSAKKAQKKTMFVKDLRHVKLID